ncbi:MAG: two-component system, OmpR family, sensor kinase [Pseudonocardiales bacterium]|nr:two-component system, OmpR family, sensor kinase [Pseudonocardiales bacterium]
MPRSLTARLVTGVVVLVVLLVAATGAGTFYALRSFLYTRLDQQLQATAGSLSAIQQLFAADSQSGPSGFRLPQTVWAVALDTSGNVLDKPSNASVEPMLLSADDRARLVARSTTGPLALSTTDGQYLHVTVRQVVLSAPALGVHVPAVVAIGLSNEEVERTLDRLVKLELVIGTSAVTLALVATGLGVRFSLRRLHGVTRTAREVAAELSPEGAGLDRRVPVHDPDTEVGQLADSMNRLLAAVETQFAARLASEDRMRQFLADASHELRTPLTSIRGYAELARIQRQSAASLDPDNLRRIESEGTRMSRLVDDLLLLARGDQGEPAHREVVAVGEVLADAVTGARAAYPQRQVSLSAATDVAVVGDPDQLQRVASNLVTNAAVHTRPDGPIDVSAEREGSWVTVRVRDAGPGLPPAEAAQVFDRFWRADKARTRARGGSGLGLSIVASLVAAHGGTVQFASTVDGGSTVTVRLPAADHG